MAVVSRLFPVLPNHLISSIRWHGCLEQVTTGGGCFVDSEHIDHRGPDEILLFYCCWVDIFIEDGQMVCRNFGRCSLSIETTLSSVSNSWDESKINHNQL